MMTKEEILEYIINILNNCNSRARDVTTELNKDKIILTVQTYDTREKFCISVKRME